MTTHSVVSEPRSFVATHLYLPESPGCALITSIVITPSVCVIGYFEASSSLPPFSHLICQRMGLIEIMFDSSLFTLGCGTPVQHASSLHVCPSWMTLGLRWKLNMGAELRSSLYSLYCFGSRLRTGRGSGVYLIKTSLAPHYGLLRLGNYLEISLGAGCTLRKTISSVTP